VSTPSHYLCLSVHHRYEPTPLGGWDSEKGRMVPLVREHAGHVTCFYPVHHDNDTILAQKAGSTMVCSEASSSSSTPQSEPDLISPRLCPRHGLDRSSLVLRSVASYRMVSPGAANPSDDTSDLKKCIFTTINKQAMEWFSATGTGR
jgi:hypothetical protein